MTHAELITAREKLMGRRLTSSEDRPAWIASRVRGITATEIAKIMRGGASAARAIIADKLAGGEKDLGHIPTIAWGHEREPIIAEWIRNRWGIEPNGYLFYAENRSRMLATPDGIGVDFDEQVILAEIKTGKHDLDPADRDGHFWTTTYMDQMQWQMFVCNAVWCVFAWEQHDDDFSGWPNVGPSPLYAEPKFSMVVRDNARIGEMMFKALEFLDMYDEAAAKQLAGVEKSPEVVIDEMTERLVALRRVEAVAIAERDRVWKELVTYVSTRDKDFGGANDRAKYSWVAPTTTTVPDMDAAQAALPDDFAMFKTVEAEYLAAKAEWEQAAGGYMKSAPKAGRLTVTEIKKKGSNA